MICVKLYHKLFIMISAQTNNAATEAVIHLKNGTRKYGMLIEECPDAGTYQFISNDNISSFNETNSSEYIEMVPGALIEAIETDLK